jgi:hypothetical protein
MRDRRMSCVGREATGRHKRVGVAPEERCDAHKAERAGPETEVDIHTEARQVVASCRSHRMEEVTRTTLMLRPVA